jgi:hypothetical protein
LDPSLCGQSDVKWAVCSFTSCIYKSGTAHPNTCMGKPTFSNNLYLCTPRVPEVLNKCPLGYSLNSDLKICLKTGNTPTDGISASLNCVTSGGTLMAASSVARDKYLDSGDRVARWLGGTLDLDNPWNFRWYFFLNYSLHIDSFPFFLSFSFSFFSINKFLFLYLSG